MGTAAFVAILVALGVGLHLFLNTSPAVLAASLRRTWAWVLIAVAVVLALRGQFFMAVPLMIVAWWILGGAAKIFPGGWTGAKSSGQKSRVRTEVLEMELDHDSGEMDGHVLTGEFAGRALSDFTTDELLDLLAQCDAAGDQSAALLEAYLDRSKPEWRETQTGASSERQSSPAGSAAMSREEAYEILGLEPGAGKDEIRAAHRSLMKSFHPDQGGSSYLATKINQAKDLLLA